MKSRPMLTLDDVTRLLEAGRREAESQRWAVTLAVVDDGGHALGLLRLDGASPASAAIALEKACTSALGRRESKAYEDMINGGRTAFVTAPLGGMLEGGVPIVAEGHVVGAVGVSGVKSEQDAQVARAAIAALGLG